MQHETMNVQVIPPNGAHLLDDAEKVLVLAQAIAIDSHDMYEIAASELSQVKSRIKTLDDKRKAITKPLDDAKKAVMDLFRRPLEMLAEAENSIKRGMLAYKNEQERQRQEEQRKAEAAAAEERRRQEQEAKDKRAAAREAEAAGDSVRAADIHEMADIRQAEADLITVPTIVTEKPRAAGVTMRKTYKARVVDLKALLQAVIDGKVPDGLVMVNEGILNAQARALKETLRYPGVEVYVEEGISARAF